jgi:A/G-specific adenine glycosylase
VAKLLPNLAQRVIAWQRQFGRHDLPWQNTRDPYRVWLSEIMLQQTQVATVISYFNCFVDRFPNVESLAKASLEEVLLYWAGLGYYARARHLHACALHVVALWGGQFPPHAESLQTLPGIGPSTAAAIAAFCFGERSPILDGNVKRVYCRYFGVEGDPTSRAVVQQLWQYAKQATPSLALTIKEPDAMARFTQGLMDLGATCCTRRQPSCNRCPLNSDCVAQLTSRTNDLPQPRLRRAIPERSTIMLLIRSQISDLLHYNTSDKEINTGKISDVQASSHNLIAHASGTHKAILLQKRPEKGIWGGLWSLPECQIDGAFTATTHQLTSVSAKRKAEKSGVTHTPNTPNQPQTSESVIRQWCVKHNIQKPTLLSMAAFRHTFTHFHLHIQPWSVEIIDATEVNLRTSNETLRWVRVDQLHLFGMPAPVKSLVLNFAVL